MMYDWGRAAHARAADLEVLRDQDRRQAEAHAHFATDRTPYDRLIPYSRLKGKEVLEIGVGSGLHAELMALAGARVYGIDITDAAVARTRRRFELKKLTGTFEQWDAERPRADFVRRFEYVWSWGVVHHSARTARIVRNIADWIAESGEFGGMVYHRDSLRSLLAIVGKGVVGARALWRGSDEILWRTTDGFSARFYTSDQWRDLLLGFFNDAEVAVTGQLSDLLPWLRPIRMPILMRLTADRRDRMLRRAGGFVTFRAWHPITPAVLSASQPL